MESFKISIKTHNARCIPPNTKICHVMAVNICGYLDMRILGAETSSPQQMCCVVGRGDTFFHHFCGGEGFTVEVGGDRHLYYYLFGGTVSCSG